MAICQNEAEITKAIWEAKAHCGAAIREAEACCAADIREAESHCVDHAHTIQQSHSNNMQCLKREAIEEEGKNCQSFLAACGIALQICPPQVQGVLMYPLQLLTGNMSLATLLAIPARCQLRGRNPPHDFLFNHPCATHTLPGDQTMTPFT